MVSDTVGGPTLHAVRRLATNVVLPVRARRFSASRGEVEAGSVRFQSSKKLDPRLIDIRDCLRRKLVGMSAILLFIGSVGWCWPVLSELRSLIAVSPAAASIHPRISYCQRFNRCRGKNRFRNRKAGSIQQLDLCTLSCSAWDAEVGYKARPREPRQDCGSRSGPLADPGPRPQSCTGETRGERSEAGPEAASTACIARRYGAPCTSHSFAPSI